MATPKIHECLTTRDDERMNLRSPGIRGAIAFGIIAATIELGAILWMAYC
jgi:hypothetical protein